MRFLRLAAAVTFGLVACGDDEGASSSTSSSSSTGSGGSDQGGGGAGQGGAGTAALVVGHLHVGAKTFAGVENPNAWQDFGFDIDGLVTTNDFTAHCQPVDGAAPNNVFPDGPNGIDNAWGKYALPIVEVLTEALGSTDLESDANAPIAAGEMSWVIDVGSIALGPAELSSPGGFFEVRNRMGETWLKAPESFSGDTPLVTFPDGTSQMSVWRSGTGSGTLAVRLQGLGGLTLEIQHARIELAVDANGDVKAARIGGVLETEAFADQVRDVFGPLFSCDGSAIDGIINQLRQSSDIMADGTQDPAETCNGISIGLGFSASDQLVGGLATALVPPDNPCEGGGSP